VKNELPEESSLTGIWYTRVLFGVSLQTTDPPMEEDQLKTSSRLLVYLALGQFSRQAGRLGSCCQEDIKALFGTTTNESGWRDR